MQPARDWWYAEQQRTALPYVGGVGLAAILGLIVLSFFTGRWDSVPQRGVTVDGDAMVHNGIGMRLQSVEYLADRTHLTLAVMSHEHGDIQEDSILPIGPDSIMTTGLGGDPSMYGTVQHHSPQGNTQRIVLAVGPPLSHRTGAKVVIAQLGFADPARPNEYRSIEGPWTFNLWPEEKDVTDWTVVDIPNVARLSAAEVNVNILQVMVSDRGVSVTYEVVRAEGLEALPIGHELFMELPDGMVVIGNQQVAASDGGSMLFPPLPVGATSFRLDFGDYIATEQGSFEVTFDVPGGVTSDIDSDEERIEVPVDTEFTIENDRLRVLYIILSKAEIEVHIENLLPPSEDSRRFTGMATESVRLVDDIGNAYELRGGSLGFEDAERGVMAPTGRTAMWFEGPLDPSATQLTLTTEQYGRAVFGPEPIEIVLPVE